METCRSASCRIPWAHWSGEPGCAGPLAPPRSPIGAGGCGLVWPPLARGGVTPLWMTADPRLRPAAPFNATLGRPTCASGACRIPGSSLAGTRMRAAGSGQWFARGLAGAGLESARNRLAEVRGLFRQHGPGWFGRFMVDLQAVVNDWKAARDLWAGVLDDLAERSPPAPVAQVDAAIDAYEEADRQRARALAFYDKLAETYRWDPAIGMAAFGEPDSPEWTEANAAGWALAFAGAIVAAIGGVALYTWLDTQRQQARSATVMARTAQDVCRQHPQSPACAQAIAASVQGPPAPTGGPVDLLAQAGKILGIGAAVFLGVQVLGAWKEARRPQAAA